MRASISLLLVLFMIFTLQTALSTDGPINAGLGLSADDKASYLETEFDFDEYEAYLSENGIAVIDGNIQIETAKQFKAILAYYWIYLKQYNYATGDRADEYWKDVTYRKVADYIVAMNLAFIPTSVLKELVEANYITSPIPFLNETNEWMDVGIAIRERLIVYAKANDERYITILPILFNADIRRCMHHLEEGLRTYIKNPQKAAPPSGDACSELGVLFEFVCFMSQGDMCMYPSQYPMELSELDPTAKTTFALVLYQIYAIDSVTRCTVINMFDLFNEYLDRSTLAKHVQQYLDAFSAKTAQ